MTIAPQNNYGTSPFKGQEGVISLAHYLRRYHNWSRWMLSPDGIYANVGRHGGKVCLKPHRRIFRWVTDKNLPIDVAFPHQLRIRFLPSLKYRTSGGNLAVGAMAFVFGGLAHADELLDMPEMEGFIMTALHDGGLLSKPASTFPFGEWVRIVSSPSEMNMSFWVDNADVDTPENVRTSWELSVVALTSVTDIEIDTSSIRSAKV